MGSMVMNMAANMLGLNNAATPLGIRAMKDLETLNPRPGTATNAMCTFLAINTSSIQLIPATAVGILLVNHAQNPSGIIGTSFMATVVAAISAIIAVKLFERLPIFRLAPVTAEEQEKKAKEVKEEQAAAGDAVIVKPLRWWGAAALIIYFAFLICVFILTAFAESWHLPLTADMRHDSVLIRIVKAISILSIPVLLSFFPLYAFLRGMPNLVAILVAIGMFRGAGGIEMLTGWLTPAMSALDFPPELLPMALVRPLSGSGTLGVFTDIVHQYGADSMLSRMAGTIFGSTETTFYVLAVYFGAANIKRTRHAVPAGLVADIVAVIASVIICRLVFK
jgi:spore maturation protein SpmB